MYIHNINKNIYLIYIYVYIQLLANYRSMPTPALIQ